MTINEAIQKRIPRLRLPVWANSEAYIRLDLVGWDSAGPWLHLFDRRSQEATGLPTPQTTLAMTDDPNFIPYDGPLDKDDIQVKG